MKAKKQSPKQSRSKEKSSDVFYVICYTAEGPEGECFYQGFYQDIEHWSGLIEATRFYSLEVVRAIAKELNERDKVIGPEANQIYRVRRNVLEVVSP